MWLLVASLGLLSVVLRAVIDPLSGFDNGFRWDYIARAMLAFHGLGFYPPVSAADFDIYSWCDGIPPLVPVLNFWIYLIAGSNAPVLTAARVIPEALLIYCAVARMARELWGEGSGPAAMAVASASPLSLWAVAMGQETGLTTLTLVTLVFLLVHFRRTQDPCAIFWAGVAAGCGALSREYGLAFILLGCGILLAARRFRATVGFGLTAAVVAGPWYVRNWMITGNPLFPHPVGGLFPSNARYLEIMHGIADIWGFGAGYFQPVEILNLLGVLMGAVFVVAVIGAKLVRSTGLPVLAAIAMVAGLCWWSLPMTAGGWVYGLRVLAPAVVLAAALAGWLGTRLPRWWAVPVIAFLFVATVDSARRSWHLPEFPFTAPWSFSFAEWHEARFEVQMIRGDKIWPALIAAAQGGGIVVDHPANHAEITIRGGLAVPLFSPRLDPIFDPKRSFEDSLRALQAANVRIFALSTNNPIARNFVAAHPFLETLCRVYPPIARIHGLAVYDLRQLAPRGQGP